jgi:hypothetical protein
LRIKVCLLLIGGFLSYLWYLNLTEADGRNIFVTAERVSTWLAPPPAPAAPVVAAPALPPAPVRRVAARPLPVRPKAAVPASDPAPRRAPRRSRPAPDPAPDLRGLY